MSHPIVIGFDGSEQARDAVALGRRLAATTGNELVVANVYFHDRMYDVYTAGDYERDARDAAQRVLTEAAGLLGSDPAEPVVLGATSDAHGLHVLAEERHASALVVGSTHRSRAGQVAPGSVGRQLLGGAPCAVAIAPRGYADAAGEGGFDSLLVAYDGSEESRHALHSAVRIARASGARIDLVGAVAPPLPTLGASYAITTGNRTFSDELEAALRGKLEEAMESVPERSRGSLDVQVADAVDVISRRSGDGGLLVCGSRGYGRGRQVLLGSTSAKLVDRCQGPLLVIPRGGEVVAEPADAAVSAEPAGR